jgi:hypothetical protein
MIAIGAAAPLAAAMAVASAATGQRLGHHATGAVVWQAGPAPAWWDDRLWAMRPLCRSLS